MSESIRAVERALDVLMCFSIQTPEMTMTQISELVGINKSTIHRLLATLEGKRFLERDPTTGTYRPGIRLIQMAFLPKEHNDLRHLQFILLYRCKKVYWLKDCVKNQQFQNLYCFSLSSYPILPARALSPPNFGEGAGGKDLQKQAVDTKTHPEAQIRGEPCLVG